MKPHEQCVVEEHDELHEKILKLDAFIETDPAFRALPAQEQQALVVQAYVMCQYRELLYARISRFPK